MKKAGRPKKKNAIKDGELKSNLCRFTFIADKKLVAAIKRMAMSKRMSIKDYMNDVLANEGELAKSATQRNDTVSNEDKMLAIMAKEKRGN